MEYASFSIDGPKGENQDRFLCPVAGQNGWVAAIADGVGGNAGGRIAAESAISAVRNSAEKADVQPRQVFLEACELIKEAAASHDNLTRMATTLSMIRVNEGIAQIAHVGDSRIYHVRGNGIVTRTEDQTEIAQLLRDGVLTVNQAKTYPRRNVITSYISASGEFDLFESQFKLSSADKIILLTDGAYGGLKKTDILNSLRKYSNLAEFSERTAEQLRLARVRDDSTMVIVKI